MRSLRVSYGNFLAESTPTHDLGGNVDLPSCWNRGEIEHHWSFDANDPGKLDDAAALFEQLGQNPDR